MLVSCWCGCHFRAEEDLAACPYCGEPACLPSLTYRDIAEMECDLAAVLAEHEPCYEPPRVP